MMSFSQPPKEDLPEMCECLVGPNGEIIGRTRDGYHRIDSFETDDWWELDHRKWTHQTGYFAHEGEDPHEIGEYSCCKGFKLQMVPRETLVGPIIKTLTDAAEKFGG